MLPFEDQMDQAIRAGEDDYSRLRLGEQIDIARAYVLAQDRDDMPSYLSDAIDAAGPTCVDTLLSHEPSSPKFHAAWAYLMQRLSMNEASDIQEAFEQETARHEVAA